MPNFYDSILPVEKAKYFPSKGKPTHIIIEEKVNKSSYIRFAGEDYNTKDVVVKKRRAHSAKTFNGLYNSWDKRNNS